MHVPEVQRLGPGAPTTTTTHPRSVISQPNVSPTPTQTTYLHSNLQTDRVSHSPTAGVYPSHSGPITPQPPNPAMVPGGYSAPFIYPTDQQTQAPRTHGGIDYSQWVAAYNQGQQQPFSSSSYGSTQWTPQQTPMFYPSVQPDLRDSGMNEALPRIGGYPTRNRQQQNPLQHDNGSYQHQHQQGYYQPSIDPSPPVMSSPEHTMNTQFINHTSNSFDQTHGTLISPPRPAQISPDPSSSPIDLPQPPPNGANKFTSRGGKSRRNKRPRRETQEVSDNDSDDAPNGGARGGMDMFSQRLPGACTHCKKLKMKCDFPADATVCKRCKNSGHQCVVEGRKPRSAPNKREYLMAQLRQKDAVIESLLKQLHNPFVSKTISIANYQSSVPPEQQNQNVVDWLDRLKSRPSAISTMNTRGPSYTRSSLSPSDALRDGMGGISDGESTGPSGENGDEGSRFTDDDGESGEGTADSLVESDRLIPDQAFPVGLFANLSLSATRKSTRVKAAEAVLANPDAQNEDDVGVANETYFMPGPATDLRIRQRLLEQTSPPEILVHGLVTPDDVDRLFAIFFDQINIFFPLLDPALHTPASTFQRCPFLFTVLCAISSRYDTEKAEIYPLAMHFAKSEASAALIKGWKSVELVQAYLLMAVYGPPARRWEEDRGWIFTGLAIRVAMDLNMHIPSSTKPQNERQARESLNRTRTWMICYNMDRSTGTQFGKPCTIKDEYIECFPADFYKSSPYNSPYDVHICSYNHLLRIVGKMHSELYAGGISSLGVNINKRLDFATIIPQYDREIQEHNDIWSQRLNERKPAIHDPIYEMRNALQPFTVGYSRLVLHSFAFQQAFVRGVQPSDKPIFMRCLEAAKQVIETMIDRLAASGYMRCSPDGWFLIVSFASAFLFKLLRPQFKQLISQAQETELLALVGRLIQTLSNPSIAIDDRHTPKVYARFLAGLLSRHRREGVASFGLQINPPGPHPLGGGPPSSAPATGGPAPMSSSNSNFGQSQSQQPNSAGYSQQGFAMQGPGQAAPQGSYNADQHQQQQPEVTVSVEQPDGFSYDASNLETDMPASGSGYSFGSSSTINGQSDGEATADRWSDDGHPAAMQVLQSQAWWDQMMLPGFSWPQPGQSPPSSTGSTFSINVPQSYPMQLPIHS